MGGNADVVHKGTPRGLEVDDVETSVGVRREAGVFTGAGGVRGDEVCDELVGLGSTTRE